MNRALSILACLVAITRAAGDWTQELSPPTPGDFPVPQPLHAIYRFGWSALPAADGIFDFKKTKTGQLRLNATVNTTGAVRALFRLDARHTALANASTLRPISMQQSEAYQDETIRTKLVFDSAGVTRTRSSDVPGPGDGKPKRLAFSPLFDLHSALLWVRSQRLQAGESYRLVVYPSADPYLAEVTVAGRERVKAAGKSYDAIKLGLKLRKVSKKLELLPHESFKRGSVWLSDDRDRLLLKAEAEIFVGNVWVELRKSESPPR